MRIINRLLIFAALSLVLTACLYRANGTSEITIGAVYNLTGAQRDLDVPSAQGARAAVERINRQGGLWGGKVTLAVVDGQSQPQMVAEKTAELLEEHPSMPGIIGLSDTDMVLAAAPVTARHKRVFLASGATSPQLPQQVPDYLFLSCFGDNVQAAVGAEWAYTKLGARQVMILYNRSSTYTRLLQKYFRTRFDELGGRVVATLPYTPDDLRSLVIQPGRIDMVYLSATPDEVLTVLAEIRKAGISIPVLGGDGLDIGTAWQKGAEFKDVFFTTHAYLGRDNTNPRVKAFKEAFSKVYPTVEPDAFTALGFDAANLLIAAIEKAGSVQPAAVRKALANTKGFQGVTGTISYRPGSRIPEKSVTIINVSQGKQTIVGEYLPAKTPAP
jgi:branched-chain amino acid transport system substrate-binding protein